MSVFVTSVSSQPDIDPTGYRGKDSDGLRLSKRLAYILRYGAEKEGLQVSEGGFIDFMELIKVPILKNHQPEDILKEIKVSTSIRGTPRFERRERNESIQVRALYGRRIERKRNHEGSNVPRLLESCLDYVCDNIKKYDLQNFPDEYLINTIIHKLKRQKRLTNKAFESILGPTMEHLDLDGVYLTQRTINLVGQRCSNLRLLSLRDCGYIMTDHFMDILLKKLLKLESLNISSCRHLTDKSLQTIIKRLSNLQHLNASNVPFFTQSGLLNLIINCPSLSHLDIFHHTGIDEVYRETMVEIAKERHLTIILQGLNEDGVTPKDLTQGLERWQNAIA